MGDLNSVGSELVESTEAFAEGKAGQSRGLPAEGRFVDRTEGLHE